MCGIEVLILHNKWPWHIVSQPPERITGFIKGCKEQNSLRNEGSYTLLSCLSIAMHTVWLVLLLIKGVSFGSCSKLTLPETFYIWSLTEPTSTIVFICGFGVPRLNTSKITKFSLIPFEAMDTPESHKHQWPLLLTWFNFNPSMDK